jgi:carboxymethylenebutenolidase
MNELIEIGNVKGHLTKPTGNGPWPTVIVNQEWWGLDAQTKFIADRFASIGYLAFAPDLYHGELAQLGDSEKAMSLVQIYGPSAPEDLKNLFDALKVHPDCNGKIGSVGFCFGGRMSLALGI